MLKFLQDNVTIILSIIILLCGIGYLISLKKWETIRCLAFELIKKAEKAFKGSKRGQEKFEHVFTQVYNLIPPWIRIFVTEEFLKARLQEWYEYIKDELDDGKINNSI